MNIEAEKIYKDLSQKLLNTVPDLELRQVAELACEINQLKREKNAIILCHNYMTPALFHSVADIAGDSLELSRKAAQTDKDIIVFCGVEFMAETAKILSPDRTVLLPAEKAGSLSNILNAAWKALLADDFFNNPRHDSKKVSILSELTLKSIEVFEIEQRIEQANDVES